MNQIKMIQDLKQTNEWYVIFENGKVMETNLSNFQMKDWKIPNNQTIKWVFMDSEPTTIDLSFILEEQNQSQLEILLLKGHSNSEYHIQGQVAQNALLNLFSVQTTEQEGLFSLKQKISIQRAGTVEYRNIAAYGSRAKVDCTFLLEEERATVHVKNVWLNSSSTSQEVMVNIHHQKPHTSSDLIHYAMSRGTSSLRIDSNGKIDKGAFQSEMHQSTKGVILDLNAIISATPLLKIDEYDVIASHGASIGAIDDDQLYYMMSRGLSKVESEKIIIAGFIAPILDELQEGPIKEIVRNLIQNKLS
jgi:Fe-S cluster assembly protein SufD